MIRHSFIHIPGIGPKTELNIWQRGICTWDDFLCDTESCGLGPRKTQSVRRFLEKSKDALIQSDHVFFNNCFPNREKWRLYDDFKESIAFLDIETTGFNPQWDDITVIGLYDGHCDKSFINGINLHSFRDEIKKYRTIVTFNGARFDLPFITANLGVTFDQIHIDLMYPLKRLGYAGGLKEIEKKMGINRSSEISSVDGFEAVRLWYQYSRRHDRQALETLIEYNIADTRNLKVLMEKTYGDLKDLTLSAQKGGAENTSAGKGPGDAKTETFCLERKSVLDRLRKLKKR